MNVESGDGFLHQVLKNLWKVDPVLKKITPVNVPDTVVFLNGGIYQWYFSKEGQILFRKKQNLEKENILSKFSSYDQPSGIVAVWIYKQREPIRPATDLSKNSGGSNTESSKRSRRGNSEGVSTEGSVMEMSNIKQNKLIYEYMNLQELEEARPGEMIDGVLQRFIQPKGEYNCNNNEVKQLTNMLQSQKATISVTWTKQFCLCERITNTRPINNKTLDIYQRVITFEADQQAVTQDLKGETLKQWLESKVTEMIKHIENSNEKQISISMFKGFFKIDQFGKVWFLQCKSLQVGPKQSEIRQQREYKSLPFTITDVPDYINFRKTTVESKDLDLRIQEKCNKCERNVDKQSIYEVEYDSIIRSWQFDHVGEIEKIKEQSEQKYEEERDRLEKLYILLDKLDLDIPEEFPKALDQDIKRFDIVSNYLIPRVIRNTEPDLTEEEYLKVLDNPGFRCRKSNVCENCCLHIISSLDWKENTAKLKIKGLNDKKYDGVGQLKPEILISRFNKTRKQVELKRMFEEQLNPNSDGKDSIKQIRRLRPVPPQRSDMTDQQYSALQSTGIKVSRRHDRYLSQLQNNQAYSSLNQEKSNYSLQNTKSVPSLQVQSNEEKSEIIPCSWNFQKMQNQSMLVQDSMNLKESDIKIISLYASNFSKNSLTKFFPPKSSSQSRINKSSLEKSNASAALHKTQNNETLNSQNNLEQQNAQLVAQQFQSLDHDHVIMGSKTEKGMTRLGIPGSSSMHSSSTALSDRNVKNFLIYNTMALKNLAKVTDQSKKEEKKEFQKSTNSFATIFPQNKSSAFSTFHSSKGFVKNSGTKSNHGFEKLDNVVNQGSLEKDNKPFHYSSNLSPYKQNFGLNQLQFSQTTKGDINHFKKVKSLI